MRDKFGLSPLCHQPACSALVLGAALALTACKKDEPPAETGSAADSKDQDGGKDGDDGQSDGDGGLGEAVTKAVEDTIADGMLPADSIQRGDVLGHVLMPNPLGFLEEIRTKAAPPQFGMFIQEATLRSALSGQLGSRAAVGEHLALDKPAGCVLVDSDVVEMPVACVMGYEGGAAALITDLGQEGKQADAKGHTGHYNLQGEDVYVDELGEMVVVSNHAEVFALAKPYVEKNVVARAPEVSHDIEMVVFLGAAMVRYKDQIEPALGGMSEMPVPADDNPFVQAMAAYSKKASEDSLQRYRDTEQVTVGMGLEELGFATRWALFPKAGSEYAKEMAAFAGGPFDMGFASKLPQGTWAAGAYRFDDKVEGVESLEELREIMVDGYAEATGKDKAAINAGIQKFYKESVDLYGPDLAMGIMHLQGSYGGIVLEVPLEPGKSGRERWKTLAAVLTPDNVLNAEAKEMVTWTWTPDATEIGGAAIDRIVIEPTDKGRKEIEKSGAQAKEWGKRTDGYKLVIDRAEVDGRAVFAISVGDATPYTTAAIEAAGGKNTIADEPGFKAISGRMGGMGISSFAALNVQGGADWVKALLPPADASKIPPKLGNDLSDFSMFAAYSKDGKALTGELVISQQLIDTLKALAK